MTRNKKSVTRRLLRWIFIWVVLPFFGLHLVLSFWHPQDRFIDAFFKRLKEEAGIEVTYRRAFVSPSFQLVLEDMIVKQAEARRMVVDGQTVRLEPTRYFSASSFSLGVSWASLLKMKIALAFTGKAYGGRFQGTIRTPVLDMEHKPLHLYLSWAKIQLKKLGEDFPRLSITRGITKGSADLLIVPGKSDVRGPVDLVIENTGAALPEIISGALDIRVIQRIEGRIRLADGSYLFEKLWVRSSSGSLRIDGAIHPGPDTARTKLDLTVRYYPHASGIPPDETKYIPVTISGTAEKPDVQFMGIHIPM